MFGLGQIIGAGTSFINGWQQRNAAKNAAKAQEKASREAIGVVDGALDEANPLIEESFNRAGQRVVDASEGAATGVLGAGTAAQGGFRTATDGANALLNPYAQGGAAAFTNLTEVANNPAKFEFSEDDPSYRFRLEESMKEMQRSAAARGMLAGGGTLLGLQRRAGQEASKEYQAAFDRFRATNNDQFTKLSTVAGMGYDAAGQMGQNEMTAGEYIGNMGVTTENMAGNYRVGGAEYQGNADQRSAEIRSGNIMDTGRTKSELITGIGNAQAAGHIGAANAWSGAIAGGNNAAQSYFAQKGLRPGVSSTPYASGAPAGGYGVKTSWTPTSLNLRTARG